MKFEVYQVVAISNVNSPTLQAGLLRRLTQLQKLPGEAWTPGAG